MIYTSACLPKRVVATTVATVLSFSTLVAAQGDRDTPLDVRARGAERVVVATARGVNPSWRQNIYGDRLIVSRVQLEVEETLKGAAARTLWMDVEGGSLDGLTLRVSDLPELKQGERAVLFLDSTDSGVLSPHLRGQGILKLDDSNIVRGSSLRLDDIRRTVRAISR